MPLSIILWRKILKCIFRVNDNDPEKTLHPPSLSPYEGGGGGRPYQVWKWGVEGGRPYQNQNGNMDRKTLHIPLYVVYYCILAYISFKTAFLNKKAKIL